MRFALRTLFRKPFVTIVAIVSLALGIGANAAIFSVFEQVVLGRLPVPAPDELVNILSPGPRTGSTSSSDAGGAEAVFSYPLFRDLERVQTVFTGIAAHRAFPVNLAYRDQTENAEGLLVSGSYFPVLRVTPALGRLFTPDDNRTPGAHPVVVLSHAYWRTRFNGNSAAINDTLRVNGQALTIIGVTPPEFASTVLEQKPPVFVPMTMAALMRSGWDGFENRRDHWIYLFARLKPGVSAGRAAATLTVPYRAILNDVEFPLQRGISDANLARFKSREIVLEEGARGQRPGRNEALAVSLLLFSVTGIVLLIACANIANLLLARAAYRATEMAIRLSIGASRGQLVRQLLTESCLLAALGGLGGLIVAKWTMDLVRSLLSEEGAAMVRSELSLGVVLFTAAVSLATGLLFGLFPALQSTRPDLVPALKAQAGQPSGTRASGRFRTSLATAQIGLAMALLVVAGLFTKSLMNISRVDLGIRVENLATFRLSPQLNGYSSEQSRAFFTRVEEEVTALPGVTGVTASTVPLLAGSNSGTNVSVEGFDAGPDTDMRSMFARIGTDYFRTLGIPLIAGREFTRTDITGAPKVAIVNEAFARKFALGRDAVGKRMRTGAGRPLDIQIVGLVRDAKYSQIKDLAPPQFFLPYRQDEAVGTRTFVGTINFYVRASSEPAQLMPLIPPLIARLDGTLPVEDLQTLSAQALENVALDRMIGILSASFAGLAMLLATVGLYGVLAYMVAQRTREIGLRMALGADAGDVRRMVFGRMGWMTLVGGTAGVLAALALGRLARSFLFELEGDDPVIIAAAAVLVTVIAFAAGIVPARRAARIDPMRALRYE